MTELLPTVCAVTAEPRPSNTSRSMPALLKDAGLDAVVPDRVVAAVDPVEAERNLIGRRCGNYPGSQSNEACQKAGEPRDHCDLLALCVRPAQC